MSKIYSNLFVIPEQDLTDQKMSIIYCKTHFMIKIQNNQRAPITLSYKSLHTFFKMSCLNEAHYCLLKGIKEKHSLYKAKELRFSLPNLELNAIKQSNLSKDKEDSIYFVSHYQGSILNHNFQYFLILWELFYCIYILLAVNIIIHLYYLILFIQAWSFYLLYIGSLLILMLKTGITSMTCFIKDQSHLVCHGAVNIEVLISLVLTLGVWGVISLLDERVEQYICNYTWYNILYIGVVVVDLILLIINYGMDDYYRERGVSISYQEIQDKDYN